MNILMSVMGYKMRVLLDTNVLLNWLIESNTKHLESARLVMSCLMDETEGFVTSHSLTDIFYVLRKYHSDIEMRKKFLMLMVHNFTILTEDKNRFLDSLNDAGFFDLEDGLQMKCAEKANLDFIVTDNLKDFKSSKVPAISIEDALAKL